MVRKTTFLKKQLLLWLFLISAIALAQTPVVNGFSPAKVTQRAAVIITGSNFNNPSAITDVRFNRPGAAPVSATAFRVVSNTQITATMPLITGVTPGVEASLTVTVVRGSLTANAPATISYIAPVATPANAGITRIITNWNGYWQSSAVSSTAANQPDTGHSLMAFKYDNILYSTGGESAVTSVLNSNSATGVYTNSNFRALPINNIEGVVPAPTGDPNLIVLGSMIDGSSTSAVPTAPGVAGLTIRNVLIDGIRGLNIGTGVTNLPASSVLTFQSGTIFNNTVLNDEIPDILVSQVASPSENSYSIYCFTDAAGNVVGKPVQVNLSSVTAVGTYKTDFFTLPAGLPLNTATINGSTTIGTNTRDIRLVGYKLSDFGLTESNRALAVRFKVMPSGTSDPAFMAYNRDSFSIPAPEIDRQPVSQAVCPGGSAQFSITVTSTGTELSYHWEKNGVPLTDGNGISGATTATLRINPVTAADAAEYRCVVTNPAGAAFSDPAYLNTVILSSTGAGTCQGSAAYVEVGAIGNTPHYQWYSNTTNSNTNGTIINGANANTYYPPVAATGTTYYYAEVYPAGYECATIKSAPVEFTVSNVNAGIATGTQNVCAGNSAIVTLTGYTGTIQWQQSVDGTNWADVTNGTGATTPSYTTGTLTIITHYRAVVTSGGCVPATSGVVTVTVNETNEWTGNASIYWNNPGNWSCGTVPTIYTTVSIPSAPHNQPTVNGVTAHAKSIAVATNAHVTIATAATLHVVNAINVANGATFILNNNGALIQDNEAGNSGKITVYRDSNPLYRLDYTMWSSPVSGQNLQAFSPLTAAGRFYEYSMVYDPAIQANREAYAVVDAATTSFATAKGYLIRMPNTDSTPNYSAGTAAITFHGAYTGVPNNGAITYPLSIAGDRYTAIGNPYPSPIGVEEFFAQNESVLNANSGVYFWRKKNNYLVSSYATLTLAGFVANSATPLAGGEATPNYTSGGQTQAGYFSGDSSTWRISQGQGFLVKAASNLSQPVISFNNSMRKSAPASGNQAFFRTGQSAISRLWLNITGSEDSFSQMAVAYIDGTTLDLDYGYDGIQLADAGTVSLYTLVADTNLTIQARPAFANNDVVPVGYVADNAGSFTIAIDHVDGVFEGDQNIYIKDNTEGLIHNIKNRPYTFTTDAGTFNNRFEIVYATSALGTDTPELAINNVVVYKENGVININSGTAKITDVTVYDVRGRKLYNKAGINATQAAITGLQVQQEVLIVEINTVKGKVSKKIIF